MSKNKKKGEDENDMYVQLNEIKSNDSNKKKKNKKKKSDSDEENSDDEEIQAKISLGSQGNQGRESISNLKEIKDINGFIVKQVFSPCETLTGCQTQNQYNVYESENGEEEITEQSIPILKSLEESNCFVRNICTGRCRPFEMTISTHVNEGLSEFNENVVLYLKRDYKCTFYCYQRPLIEVFQIKKGTHELVGKVLNPFNCTRLSVQVSDKYDKILYNIDTSCCDCAYICQNFGCKPCQEMIFNVIDYDGNEFTNIKKTSSGCCVSCVSDTSKYFINFPDRTDNSEKLLLLAATILIDYMYFEGGSKICLNF